VVYPNLQNQSPLALMNQSPDISNPSQTIIESIANQAVSPTNRLESANAHILSLVDWLWLGDCTVSVPSGLHTLAVDSWGTSCGEATLASLVAAIVVDVLEVECVDVAWDVSV
jgi:hypothetical protein